MPSQFRYAGNAIAYATVVEALCEAAYTIDELIKLSGLAENTTWKFVKALQRKRCVYIAVWRTDKMGRYTKPAFSFGSRADVQRPSPKSATRRSAERRQRDALRAMARQYDEATSDAPRQDAKSKMVEEDLREPSA